MRLVPYGGDSGGLLMGLEAALVVMVCLYVVVDLWALTFAVRRGWEWGGFRGVKHELKQLLRGWTLYGWLLIAMFWAVYGLRKAVTAEMDALNGLRAYFPAITQATKGSHQDLLQTDGHGLLLKYVSGGSGE